MSSGWQSKRNRAPRKWIALGAVFIGLLAFLIVRLESHRSRRLLTDSVRVHRNEAGDILSAQAVIRDFGADQWSLLTNGARLQSLNLEKTDSVAGGLRNVSRFGNLQTLNVSGCRWVDDDEMRHVVDLSNLHYIDLSGTSITDQTVAHLRSVRVMTLDLDQCPGITDVAIDDLIAMSSLQQLDLSGTSVTLDGFDRLKQSRPELSVELPPEELLRGVCEVRETTAIPRQKVIWITDETDIPRLVRFFQLFKRGLQGGWQPDGDTTDLHLAGPAAGESLSRILAEFPFLESLTISETVVTDGLETLPSDLRSLSLKRLDPKSQLGGVSDLTKLESVHLQELDLPIHELRLLFTTIASNAELQHLTIRQVDLPRGSLDGFQNLQHIQFLYLSRCGIDKDDLMAIGRTRSLTTLDIFRTQMSDEAAESLLHFPKIAYLSLSQTGIGAEVADQLRERYGDALKKAD